MLLLEYTFHIYCCVQRTLKWSLSTGGLCLEVFFITALTDSI